MDYFVGFGLVRGSAFFRRLGEGFVGLTLVGVQRLGAVLVRIDFEQGISKIRAGGSLPANHSASTRVSLPVDPWSNYKHPDALRENIWPSGPMANTESSLPSPIWQRMVQTSGPFGLKSFGGLSGHQLLTI
ncbi:hypothetical protein [Rhizobium sp. LEGMi135b]